MIYRLFSRVLAMLMSRGEVGDDLFASIAFDSGSFSSLWMLVRHASGWTPLPRSRRAIRCYAAMAVNSLYVVVLPTLFSAMTGYTTFYTQFISFNEGNNLPGQLSSTTNLLDCSEILPAWGFRGAYSALETGPVEEGTIDYDQPGRVSSKGWIDCTFHLAHLCCRPNRARPVCHRCHDSVIVDIKHFKSLRRGLTGNPDSHRYANVYEECPSAINISGCAAADKPTWVLQYYEEPPPNMSLYAPMPGIVTWPDLAPHYTHWDCGGTIIESSWLIPDSGNATGVCQAEATYAWGFSFLLTFLVSVLTFVFALIIYALWSEVRRHGGDDHGSFKDAILMLTQAQATYGAQIGEWSASSLQREITKGKQGMTTASTRKHNVSDDRHESRISISSNYM